MSIVSDEIENKPVICEKEIEDKLLINDTNEEMSKNEDKMTNEKTDEKIEEQEKEENVQNNQDDEGAHEIEDKPESTKEDQADKPEIEEKSPTKDESEGNDEEPIATKKKTKTERISRKGWHYEAVNEDEKPEEVPKIVTGRRATKTVEHFKPQEKADKKELSFEGNGTKLGDIPFFEQQISRASDAVGMKVLHHFLFSRVGAQKTYRAHLRNFNGFTFEKDSPEYAKKVAWLETNRSHFAPIRKAIHATLKGERIDQCKQVVDLMMKPDPADFPKERRVQKRKSSSAKSPKSKKSTASKSKPKGKAEKQASPVSESEDEQQDDEITESEEEYEEVIPAKKSRKETKVEPEETTENGCVSEIETLTRKVVSSCNMQTTTMNQIVVKVSASYAKTHEGVNLAENAEYKALIKATVKKIVALAQK